MRPSPHTDQRDALLDQLLPYVAQHGWSVRAHPAEPAFGPLSPSSLVSDVFPAGAPEMIEAFCDLADRRMVAAAALLDPGLRPSQRLRATLALRLAQNWPHRSAIRKAIGILMWPGQAARAARCTFRTVDALWSASGDRSVDISWYTKRGSLALVYQATLLFWLADRGDANTGAMAFFDRQVAGLREAGRWRARRGGTRKDA